MSHFFIGNIFLLGSMILATVSQIVIKSLMNDFEGSFLSLVDIRSFLDVTHLSIAAAGGAMVAGGFICWLLALARLELSYAYPIACTSVLLVPLFSVVFLGEVVTLRMALGTLLILAGIVLLMPGSSAGLVR